MKITMEGEGITVTIEEDIVKASDIVTNTLRAIVALGFAPCNVYDCAVQIGEMELGEVPTGLSTTNNAEGGIKLVVGQEPTECTCNAKPERMSDGRYGLFHDQSCPRYDGDHAEMCGKPTDNDAIQGDEK